MLTSGLLAGLTPRHIQLLCKGGLDGVYGYTPQQIGDMTLDQIFMLFAETKYLRGGRKRVVPTSAHEVASMSKDGLIKGRDEEGKPIQRKVAGKSWARQLMEQEEAKRKAEEQKKERKRRKRRRRENIDSKEERRRNRDGA